MKLVDKVGWLSSFFAIAMFSSYIDQIRLNLLGSPGSVVLPIATVFNCLCWVIYALLKEKVDWPVFVCNSLGFLLGTLTFLTSIFPRII